MQEEPRNSRRLDSGPPGLVDDVGLDHQVGVDELGRIGAVGMDTADPGGGQHHVIDGLAAEELPHVGLTGEIELGMGPGNDMRTSALLQPADDRRPDHAAVAGDMDPHRRRQHRRFLHQFSRHPNASPAAAVICSPVTHSLWLSTVKPSRRQRSSRLASSRSARIISATSSVKPVVGTQPSFSLALLGSPSRVSTSVGRK